MANIFLQSRPPPATGVGNAGSAANRNAILGFGQAAEGFRKAGDAARKARTESFIGEALANDGIISRDELSSLGQPGAAPVNMADILKTVQDDETTRNNTALSKLTQDLTSEQLTTAARENTPEAIARKQAMEDKDLEIKERELANAELARKSALARAESEAERLAKEREDRERKALWETRYQERLSAEFAPVKTRLENMYEQALQVTFDGIEADTSLQEPQKELKRKNARRVSESSLARELLNAQQELGVTVYGDMAINNPQFRNDTADWSVSQDYTLAAAAANAAARENIKQIGAENREFAKVIGSAQSPNTAFMLGPDGSTIVAASEEERNANTVTSKDIQVIREGISQAFRTDASALEADFITDLIKASGGNKSVIFEAIRQTGGAEGWFHLGALSSKDIKDPKGAIAKARELKQGLDGKREAFLEQYKNVTSQGAGTTRAMHILEKVLNELGTPPPPPAPDPGTQQTAAGRSGASRLAAAYAAGA